MIVDERIVLFSWFCLVMTDKFTFTVVNLQDAIRRIINSETIWQCAIGEQLALWC
jgi:hypothetical protein